MQETKILFGKYVEQFGYPIALLALRENENKYTIEYFCILRRSNHSIKKFCEGRHYPKDLYDDLDECYNKNGISLIEGYFDAKIFVPLMNSEKLHFPINSLNLKESRDVPLSLHSLRISELEWINSLTKDEELKKLLNIVISIKKRFNNDNSNSEDLK